MHLLADPVGSLECPAKCFDVLPRSRSCCFCQRPSGCLPERRRTSAVRIRRGWLDAATYQPIVDRAWQAIRLRTASDGRLFDVAESTGTRGLTQKDYLRRAAILDVDPRGGAFAMLLAIEMAGLADN